MMLLELSDIHTYYGRSHILQGVSLRVEEGEIVTLIGRNGAGKTTTLRSIIGLNPPRQGIISFRGEPIHDQPTHLIAQKGISFVPEDRRVIPNLTVYENLKLGMLQKKNPEKDSQILDRVYNYFPRLKERERQVGRSLSGGEQQMLAVARGFVSEPSLMLIDEPTEGLMPTIVMLLAEIFTAMNKDGVTILLVEQNVEVALDISGRAYIIDEGRIHYEGTAEEIKGNREMLHRFLGVS